MVNKNTRKFGCRRLLSLVLCLVLSFTTAATAFAEPQEPEYPALELLDGYKLDAYAADSYWLKSESDWNALAAYVAAGHDCHGWNFKMYADFAISRPLGQQVGDRNHRMRFAGSFDGNGHTLTVSINTNTEWFNDNKGYAAPFAYVKNTSISNLHVAGTIITTGQWAAGLVGSTGNNSNDGACTIDHVHVSVEIVNNYSSHGSTYANHGGVVGIPEGSATITNSWFDGSFSGSDYKYSGGFIGLNNKTFSYLENCLFNPSSIAAGMDTEGACEFVHSMGSGSHVLTNCCSVTTFGAPENAQGTHVKTEYEQGDEYDPVSAIDGNTYYYILHSAAWATLQGYFTNDASITLDRDYTAGVEDDCLRVPDGKTLELNLNGHTIDRALYTESAKENGFVILVEGGGSLTINGSGVVKGGHNTGNGGGIYVKDGGTLTLAGAAVKENKIDTDYVGGGVYVEDGGTLHVSGDVQIRNNATVINGTARTEKNLYLAGSAVIDISGALDSSARIGVSTETARVFTSGLSGNGNKNNFISDNADRVVWTGDAGEARLVDHLYTVTVSNPASGGTVKVKSGTQSGKAAEGDTVTLTVTPAANYEIGTVSYNDGTVHEIEPVNSVYSFAMPASNVTVTATFIPGEVTLSVTAEQGNAAVSPDKEHYYVGDVITVTAAAVDEFDFDGWYEDDTQVAEDYEYTFTITKDTALTAKYTATGSVQVKIDGGSTYTIKVGENNAETKTSPTTASYPCGTSLTIEALDDGFQYWVNDSGKILSRSQSYTFTVTGPVSISAAFSSTGGMAALIFESAYGQVMARGELPEGGSMSIPSVPVKNGYIPVGWFYNGENNAAVEVKDADSVTEAIRYGLTLADKTVIIKPVYSLNENSSYTITVTGGTGGGTYQQNAVVTARPNAAPADQKFSHWVRVSDDVILSYNAVFSFYAETDIDIEAVFVETDTPVDAVGTAFIVRTFKTVVNETSKKLSFVSMSTVPEGCTIVKSGVVATNNSDIGGSADDFKDTAAGVLVRGDAWDGRAYRYTWTKKDVHAGDTWYVRAYLVYTDANGDLHTVYGDIVSLSY